MVCRNRSQLTAGMYRTSKQIDSTKGLDWKKHLEKTESDCGGCALTLGVQKILVVTKFALPDVRD